MSTAAIYENHLHASEPRWFAVYTRYKREKLLLRHLEEKGIHSFLPLQQLTRKYDRKVRKVELPLISCYIFTKITAKEYVKVLNTPYVVNFVKFAENLISIPEEDIECLRRIVEGNVEVDVEQSSYQVGNAVEIIAGNLVGVKGILVEQKNKKNFLVELNTIGYALRMQVDPSFLRKVG